jgi:MOSC domain-containing protein YiiM
MIDGEKAMSGEIELPGAKAKVLAVCVSARTGVQKRPVDAAELVVGHGIAGDAHAGDWHRQVSLLADESAQRMRDAGAAVGPGDFGENLLTAGIVLVDLPIGARLRVGGTLLEVTQIGKECHSHCAIFHAVGDCVMPREGIFCRVIEGGPLRPDDPVERIG